MENFNDIDNIVGTPVDVVIELGIAIPFHFYATLTLSEIRLTAISGSLEVDILDLYNLELYTIYGPLRVFDVSGYACF